MVIIEHSGMLGPTLTTQLALSGKHHHHEGSSHNEGTSHGCHLVLLTNKPANLKKAALDFETIALEAAQVSVLLRPSRLR